MGTYVADREGYISLYMRLTDEGAALEKQRLRLESDADALCMALPGYSEFADAYSCRDMRGIDITEWPACLAHAGEFIADNKLLQHAVAFERLTEATDAYFEALADWQTEAKNPPPIEPDFYNAWQHDPELAPAWPADWLDGNT